MKWVLMVVLPLAVTGAACAPVPYRVGPYPGPYAGVNPYPHGYARAAEPAASVLGRWDNVMLLPPGTPVQVLMFDGTKPAGEITSATGSTMGVMTVSGEVVLPAGEVMRVDRLPLPAAQEYGKAAARGAAVGAGVVGVLGLLAGHVPPARVFAAGAVIGAGAGVQDASYVRGPVMIYLAAPRSKQEMP